MFHVCRSASEQVRARLKQLKVRDDAKGTGCHNGQSFSEDDRGERSADAELLATDLRSYACYPVPPPWVARKPAKLLSWWRRLLPSSVLAPLRTKLNIDGASHGERIHQYVFLTHLRSTLCSDLDSDSTARKIGPSPVGSSCVRKVSQAFSASSLLCARAYLTEVMNC